MNNLKYFFFISLLSISLYAQEIADSLIYRFTFKHISYELIKYNLTWEEAAKYADERGGILAEIDSQLEQDSIFYNVNKANIDISKTIAPDGGEKAYIWLGGNDMKVEGKWIWDGNNDNFGDQFWEGTTTGSAVNGLYNNWGSEPDNFSGQDGLGLALENWARGKAGQWNDVMHINELFFLVEYDSSTMKIDSLFYLNDQKQIYIKWQNNRTYDSLKVLSSDIPIYSQSNISLSDSVILVPFLNDITQVFNFRLLAFYNDKIVNTKETKLEIYSFNDPQNSFYSDFENLDPIEFSLLGFSVEKIFPFRDSALHTIHNYNNNNNLTATLSHPIVVSNNEAYIKFSEVVMVEPGDSNANFGELEFNDYVIVEGSKSYNEWIPLKNGYDSRLHDDWLTVWKTGGLLRNYYKRNEINLTESFSVGDTILIRFRLFSNEEINGWGWVIDSLEIQDFPLNVNYTDVLPTKYKLDQNYPNPFNPTTVINYSIPNAITEFNLRNVTIKIYDVLGREIKTLLNDVQEPGNHTITFDASGLSAGIYLYQLKSGEFIKTKKMLLIK